MIKIKYKFEEINEGIVSFFYKVFTIYEVENGDINSFLKMRFSNKSIFDHTYFLLVKEREIYNDPN